MGAHRPQSRVVIVGASLAGLATAEALRAPGFGGDVLIIGSEPALPYARPPLSKQVLLGEWEPEQATMLTAAELDALNIQVRTGTTATGLDIRERTVELSGERVRYDVLVIATGTTPRRALVSDGPRVHALRTLDDVRALRDAFTNAARVAIAGSGVLGSEIAAAARRIGLETVLAGRSPRLSLGAAGTLLSDQLVAQHRETGVDLRLRSAPRAVRRGRRRGRRDARDGGASLVLDDGTAIDADVFVEAVGSEPATRWLAGSGLTLADGVVCDETGLAAPGVFAVGDVARWIDPVTGQGRRIEHQAHAIAQALSVAASIAGAPPTPPGPAFFWSEIHGIRIQVYGEFDPASPLTVIDGDDAGRAVYASRGPHGVAGIVGWNAPRLFRDARRQVDASQSAPAPSAPALASVS